MNFFKALFYFEAPQSGYRDKHPHWPLILLYAGWWLRNPFPGITEFILNLPDVVSITGTCPSANFNPKGGFNFCLLTNKEGKKRRWVSYRGKYIEFYFGNKPQKPNSSFGIALRKANAKPINGPHI